MAGLLAVEFRYPSLWGNSDIFPEYAYPLPYGWALAHWISMSPLTFWVFRMPTWDTHTLMRSRWILLAIVTAAVLFEFIYGNGRWHRIPFVLFVLVDSAIALIIAMIIKPPRKLMAGLGISGALLLIFWTVGTPLIAAWKQNKNVAALATLNSKYESLRAMPTESLGDDARVIMEVQLDVAGTLDKEALCYEALKLFEGTMELFPSEKRANPWIQFVARSKRSPDTLTSIGEARYTDRGRWQCDIELVPR